MLTLAGIATITLLHRRLHRQYTALLESEPVDGGPEVKGNGALQDRQAAQLTRASSEKHAGAWLGRVPAQMSSISLLASGRLPAGLQDSANKAGPARTAHLDKLEEELDPFADVDDTFSSPSASASRRVSSQHSSDTDEGEPQDAYRYSVASFAPSSILSTDTRDTNRTTHTQTTQISEAVSTEYYGRTQTRTVPLRDARPRRG